MIDVLPSIVEQLNTVSGFNGRVYRKWPKKIVTKPSCLVSRISAFPVLTDENGGEVIATLTYSVDINAESADRCDELAAEVIDALASISFHRTGDSDFYDDTIKAARRILTFMGTVDTRGQTFTQ